MFGIKEINAVETLSLVRRFCVTMKDKVVKNVIQSQDIDQ